MTHLLDTNLSKARQPDATARTLSAFFDVCAAWLEEHRKAQAATRLHRELAHLSDDALDQRGLSRDRIARHIKDQLY